MKKTHVKICCISSIEEAQMAIDAGASALGLVGPMPSGPGIISNEMISKIVQAVANQSVETFLLTSETTVEGIYNHYQKTKTTTIQLVDKIEKDGHARLKELLPEVKIIQVLHVLGKKTIDEAERLMQEVDALLLDSGNPNLKIKTLGGTGNTHNWEISKSIVRKSKIPVWLAGGLKPENIQEAIEMVQPYGVDLCSGVRMNGNLNENKLFSFFDKVKNGRN
ncbi:MAG: phosphoribosylanthranilate isomerase [Saprospiraceae bacterium]